MCTISQHMDSLGGAPSNAGCGKPQWLICWFQGMGQILAGYICKLFFENKELYKNQSDDDNNKEAMELLSYKIESYVHGVALIGGQGGFPNVFQI